MDSTLVLDATMDIVVLAKNETDGTPGLRGEHGLSSVGIVFGGAHLRSASEDRFDWAAGRTHELTRKVSLGHCTGKDAEASFARTFGDRFRRLRTGWRWQDDAPTEE